MKFVFEVKSELALKWKYDDGGRKESGFQGDTGDCVVRSIAIALGKDYQVVYNELNAIAKVERPHTKKGKRSSSRTGVFRRTYENYLKALGWQWVPTMKFGQGCRVHLRKGELPEGRLIVAVSKHLCAVIDGVIHDTHDPGRQGQRCVYGYYIKEEA